MKTISAERLADPQFYFETAMELGVKIARHYHPQARDPLSELSVPEILAVAHLACEDLEQWVRDYAPGSHLLTVRQWHVVESPELAAYGE